MVFHTKNIFGSVEGIKRKFIKQNCSEIFGLLIGWLLYSKWNTNWFFDSKFWSEFLFQIEPKTNAKFLTIERKTSSTGTNNIYTLGSGGAKSFDKVRKSSKFLAQNIEILPCIERISIFWTRMFDDVRSHLYNSLYNLKTSPL